MNFLASIAAWMAWERRTACLRLVLLPGRIFHWARSVFPMKGLRFARWLAAAALASAVVVAETLEEQADRWTVEERGCINNLKFIFEALQAYRAEHAGRLPDSLWDLTPALIRDEQILVCPLVRNRGGLRAWSGPLHDPGYDPHSSYGYEFTRNRIATTLWRGLPPKTFREVKERQMEKLGAEGGGVAMVRCHHHAAHRLNLGFNGRVYRSGLLWEQEFTNNISLDDLALPGRLFLDRSAVRTPGPEDFPPRDPNAPARAIDLTGYYNGRLDDGWQGFPANDLAEMPSGLQEFGGVLFDARGVIQLNGMESTVQFPRSVTGIPIQQKFQRIHCLHAATFPLNLPYQIGAYVLCYADGESAELPIFYGRELADWWDESHQPVELANGRIAWAGGNRAAAAYQAVVRVFHSTWENPRPDVEVASFDFVSREEISAPFLIAITVEP